MRNVEREPTPDPDPSGPAAAPRARTVLIVEVEAPIRAILRATLTAHGFQALVASTGPEALDMSAAHAGPIDVVVTDLLMPGMNGDELIRQLLTARPNVHVIYISGYPGSETTLPVGGTGKTTFVPKPFTPKEFIEVVRAVLA
jgi:DNA-binding response OmpR family regulator